MNRDALKEWCRLHDFLNAEPEGEEDVTARLTAAGVDVQGTVDRVKAMVRKAYQADLREQAAREQKEADTRARSADDRVAAMPLALVMQMLTGRAAARAFFRDKSPEECSEEDLRSLLADILAAEEGDAEAEDTPEPETGR